MQLDTTIAQLKKEIEGLKEQIASLAANAGDQVNQLHAEITRLKEEHGQSVSTMMTQFGTEKTQMESDFEQRLAALTAEYEQRLVDQAIANDQAREQVRAELQAKIDELLRQIEAEK
jgi:chromosome segregation ATPase